MIARDAVRQESARLRCNASLVERDYVAGWLLRAIAGSSVSGRIAFKGGTALSRVHYWRRWRHSEDLDFSASDSLGWDDMEHALRDEVPPYLQEHAQMHTEVRRRIHTNPAYAQARIKYVGRSARTRSRWRWQGPHAATSSSKTLPCRGTLTAPSSG